MCRDGGFASPKRLGALSCVQAEPATASIAVVQIANLVLLVTPNSCFPCGEAMLIGIIDCDTP